MSFKSVEHRRDCPCGVKRGFANERLADRAMGRAQTKRLRRVENITGSRRGARVEHRSYECPFGTIHLTSENRRSYQSREFCA